MASVGRSSALLASGTMVSRVLGFVKAIILANAIGVVGSVSADAYTTSMIVPNTLYGILAMGVLNAVLVPLIVRASSASDGGRGYINKLVTVGMLIFAAVAAAATVSSPWLMHFYGVKPAQLSLATAFAFWSMPQIFFLGLYTLLGEVLNARKSFGPFTWAPVANNLVGITVLVIFVALYGTDPHGARIAASWSPGMIALLAGGASLGIAVQGVLLFWFWRRVGLSFRLDFRWRGVNLGTAGRMAMWTFAMLVTTQAAGWIETRVANTASGQGASVFAMQNAWLIFMLPFSVVALSISTATYTEMAEDAHHGDWRAFRANFSQAARLIALFTVFFEALLMVVSRPFAAVFVAGETATSQFAILLITYLIALVPYCLIFVAQRAFYAVTDTRTPFFYTLVQSAVIVAGTLFALSLPAASRATGIAAAITVATFVQLTLSWTLLRRRLGGLDGRRILASMARFLLAIIPPVIVGLVVLWLLGGFRPGGFAVAGALRAIVSMAVVTALMAPLYLFVLGLIRAPELAGALAPLRRMTRRLRGWKPPRQGE